MAITRDQGKGSGEGRSAAAQGLGGYVVAMIAVLAITGALLSVLFRGPGDALAVWVTAAVALSVQLGVSALGRLVGRGPAALTARMGIGMMTRLLALVVYALLVAVVFKMRIVAALISMAAFFFLTTLVEPFFIRS